MSRILLTGCTSPQANPVTSRSVMNFPGLLRRALQGSHHDVIWREPSISWTGRELLDTYDHVVVGMAPITSLSANRVYGALSVIGEMMSLNPYRIVIMLDAPEPQRIVASFRAILAHPENLTKPFYAYRKEYRLAVAQHARLLRIVHDLSTQPWPSVIVPVLPWEQKNDVKLKAPFESKRLTPLNLDTYLFNEMSPPAPLTRQEVWTVEGSPAHTTTLPQLPIPRKGHQAADEQVLRQLASSIGCLVEVPRLGDWWNTRYVQSLVAGTPVFSDWRLTGHLGEVWSQLPGNLETMPQDERDVLAQAQRYFYQRACPDEEDIALSIFHMLRRSNYAPSRGAR